MIASLFTIKKIMKTKIKSYDDEATDFYDKQVSKADSDYV